MSRGKKIFLILAIIIVAIGGSLFFAFQTVEKAQNELNPVVESMIKDLSANGWNKESLDKYASPALKKWLTENNFTNGMPAMRALGKIEEYKGIQKFQMSSNVVELLALVKFDTGDAYITLRLSKHDGQWLMDNFNINSPALLKK